MSFSSLIKRWFGKRQGTIVNGRNGSIQIRTKSGARKRVKLMLEILEDRLAPATLAYNSTANELDFTASTTAASAITMTALLGNKVEFQVTNDTIIYNSTNVGTSYTLSLPAATISNFNVYLPGSSSFADTLSFGLGNPASIANVNIGGPGTPSSGSTAGAMPATDTNDTVTLNSTTLSGALSVSAETIVVNGGSSVPYQGQVTIAGAAGSQTIVMPSSGLGWANFGLAPLDYITIGGMTGSGQNLEHRRGHPRSRIRKLHEWNLHGRYGEYGCRRPERGGRRQPDLRKQSADPVGCRALPGERDDQRRPAGGTTLCRISIPHRGQLGHVWLPAWGSDYHLGSRPGLHRHDENRGIDGGHHRPGGGCNATGFPQLHLPGHQLQRQWCRRVFF